MSTTTLTIDPSTHTSTISPLLFGHNLEHTRRAVWQGLSAELLANRKFCGEPGHQGVATQWYSIGPDTTIFRLESSLSAYAQHEGVDLASRGSCDFSVQQQKIQNCRTGQKCGIGQADVTLIASTAYAGFLALRSDRLLRVAVRLTDQPGRRIYFSRSFAIRPGAWREISFRFTPRHSDQHARIEITFDRLGTLLVGAASLLPARNFHGLRSDIIEHLQDISTTLLRWPGGNFAGDYRWKDGLLPVHQRGGLKGFFDQTLRYTNDYDTHEIGIDDFIALCQKLDAAPFITINISLETPQNAADWVEYCNGSAKTRWGKVRALRGHPEPYNVKYWSLGNEAGYGHMKGPNRLIDYVRMAHECATAMRGVDPSIELVASGTWFPGWAKKVPSRSYADFEHVSYHWYVNPPMNDVLDRDVKRNLRRIANVSDLNLERLRELRKTLDRKAPRGRRPGISYDEWNMWYCWNRRPMVVDAVYATAELHMICRNAQELGLSIGAYFQPVNEGAILVTPEGSELSTIGQVFELLRPHQDARLITLPYQAGSPLDTLATLSRDGRTAHVSIVNRSFDRPQTLNLKLPGQKATMLQFTPDADPACAVRFRSAQRYVSPASPGCWRLELPPFSVTRLTVPLLAKVR